MLSYVPRRVFKADTLQLLARYEGHADKISGVSKLRDSGNYISAGYDGGLFLWLSTAQLHNRKGIIAKTAQFPAGLFGSR